MKLTVEELKDLSNDPTRMQQLVLSRTGVFSINEPTNPFVMLVEAASVLSAASSVETVASLHKIYPSLATNETDIFHHISDNELINIFSHPSETSIVFYLNVRDIKSQARYNNTLRYYETYIQAGTEVNVTGIPFTLLNDINIKLYDTGSVFAEQLTSTNDLANNSLGILPAGIVSFQDGEPWLAVETTIKQLKKSTINRSITAAEGFKLDVKHTDKYHYSDVHFKNASTNGIWVPMLRSHSSDIINPDIPTVYIKVLDKMVSFSIPDVYLISGQVSGELRITLYETKGYLDLPIYKYQMSEYNVVLNTDTADPVKASIANITVFANSRDILNGGSTGYTFSELRESVINNTLGHTTTPITTSQLAKSASLYGFELFNALDVITQRVFVATKNIDRHPSKLIYTKPDVFFNTVSVNLGEINNNTIIKSADYTLIPSDTLFKEVNGIVTIVPDSELAIIEDLSNIDKIGYLKTNKLFFTPYYYVLDTSTTAALDTRVYDLDTPTLRDIRITGKNINILARCNVGKYGLVKTTQGYVLTVTVLSNDEFKATNTNLLVSQLSIPLFGNAELVHFAGSYDPGTELLTFNIDTNFNLTTDDKIELTNGVAGISNVFADLIVKATIYLITTDPNIVDTSRYLESEVKLDYPGAIVMDKEEITIEFGRSVDYVWNKMFVTYTDRKYLKHTVDKPLVYKDDVYTVDPVTGSIIQVITDPNTGSVSTVKTLLHAKGDPVLDVTGTPVIEYRVGDVVLTEDGLPAVDMYSGITRNIDILMLEYEFMVANTTAYRNYLNAVKDTIKGWLFSNLESINGKVLENTKVLYKSYKSAIPVELTTESINTVIPYSVIPTVTVYSTRQEYSDIEIANLKTEIGYLLHGYLDKQRINLTDLKKEIVSGIDNNIVSIKLEGIEPYKNSEVFDLTSPTVRLTPGKLLQLNSSGELDVVYDIRLRVHSV